MGQSADEKAVFAIIPARGDEPATLVFGLSKAAREYMKDGMAHDFDLTEAGLPLKIVIFGSETRDEALKTIKLGAQIDGVPMDYSKQNQEFPIKNLKRQDAKPSDISSEIRQDGTCDFGWNPEEPEKTPTWPKGKIVCECFATMCGFPNDCDYYAPNGHGTSVVGSKSLADWKKKHPDVPPVDRSSVTLTDGSPVTPDHREDRGDGQQKGYIVLSDAERAKGFVRPVRNSYVHLKCGEKTTMGTALAETYARDPSFYSGTFCAACRAHFPVGENGEFVWSGTREKVGT